MALVKISDAHRRALIAARTSYNPKSARKAAWRAIRADSDIARYIPSGAKLGVDVDGSGTYALALYVKNSTPRRYLSKPDAATAVPVTSDGRFMAAVTPDTTPQWTRVDRETLRAILSDQATDCPEDFERVAVLPAGFPQSLPDTAVVLDGATGHLYFRPQ